jgi:hypothetical protein
MQAANSHASRLGADAGGELARLCVRRPSAARPHSPHPRPPPAANATLIFDVELLKVGRPKRFLPCLHGRKRHGARRRRAERRVPQPTPSCAWLTPHPTPPAPRAPRSTRRPASRPRPAPAPDAALPCMHRRARPRRGRGARALTPPGGTPAPGEDVTAPLLLQNHLPHAVTPRTGLSAAQTGVPCSGAEGLGRRALQAGAARAARGAPAAAAERCAVRRAKARARAAQSHSRAAPAVASRPHARAGRVLPAHDAPRRPPGIAAPRIWGAGARLRDLRRQPWPPCWRRA